MSNKNSEFNFTELKKHKKEGKELIPPLNQIPMATNNSWIDNRLPEILWAVLLVNLKSREDWLSLFRKISDFIKVKDYYFDVTFFGLEKLELNQKEEFIQFLSSISDEVSELIACILYIKSLPDHRLWFKYFQKYYKDDNFSLSKLANAVSKTFDHQSQEATDVKWLKVLCMIKTGKMKFLESMEETVKGILLYPNYEDQRTVRPTIRSIELVDFQNGNDYNFSKIFWDEVLNTQCIESETIHEETKALCEQIKKFAEEEKPAIINNCKKLRNSLFEHYFLHLRDKEIDYKQESVFGLTYYGVSLFTELIFNTNLFAISSRISVRVLVEILINLKYSLEKEVENPEIWKDYMSYGVQQAKLTWLKLEENNFEISMIDKKRQYLIANQDKWMEFVNINLGHWDNNNLRKMSEEIGFKYFYDKYYGYTSSFVHGHWNAVSESVMQTCTNPLHRFHKIPQYNLPIMPNALDDANEVILEILKLYEKVYPDFKDFIDLSNFSFNR